MSRKIPVMTPDPGKVNGSNMKKFMDHVNLITGKNLKDYSQLYEFSVENNTAFWKILLDYSGIRYEGSPDAPLKADDMFLNRWFDDLKLNFAENLLSNGDPDAPAIVSYRESHPRIELSFREVIKLSQKLASKMKAAGIGKGDVIAAFISNVPEAVIGMLAASSIGAVWSSTSPDFGINGVYERFGQIKPAILIGIEEYIYAGKVYNVLDKVKEIASKLDSLKQVLIVPAFENFRGEESVKKNENLPEGFCYFHEYFKDSEPLTEYDRFGFNEPLYIMYSSGTTGKPKCIVHGAGGTLIQHFKELSLHTNLNKNDKILYFTTTGWMMWNWLVSSLVTGACVVLYDGSPVHPVKTALWDIAENEGLKVLGTSPKYLTMCEKTGIIPSEGRSFDKLEVLLSTGSPLSADNFRWVYKNVKPDILLSSISGGTDIISCFMLGNPMLPVYEGEIQCRGLGMSVKAFDPDGNDVSGAKGELVCDKPFPSMPVFFLNDPGDKKYRSAYFEYYPGIWRHGDFIEVTDTGGVIVYGRSDSTLNPGGVRIGTAEIYQIAESIPEITDSLVVGVNRDNDIKVVLFTVLRAGRLLDERLVKFIKDEIKASATPRHVPSMIFQVTDIPRTISGKKVEIAVTRILNGETIDNREALANPESLDQFYTLYNSGRV